MGTVYKRNRKDSKSGKWYVEYWYGGKKIKRLARRAETKTEAKAFLHDIERQIALGLYDNQKKEEFLFEKWSKIYIKWSKVNKRSWKRDISLTDNLKSFFKGRLLKEITPMMIENYKRKRLSSVKPATVNRELSCLRRMFNMAMDERLLTYNPMRKVRFLREEQIEIRRLNQEEKRSLIANANGITKYAVIIAMNTGLRRTELFTIKWVNVDFQEGCIYVKKTKSGKPRTIPMNSMVLKVLEDLHKNRKQEEYVFWNWKTKRPFIDLKKSFKTACRNAGIKGLRFHDLRHNFASDLVERGVDIVTVSKLLGHSDINLTSKRYSHPSPEHMKRAVDKLNHFKQDYADLSDISPPKSPPS